MESYSNGELWFYAIAYSAIFLGIATVFLVASVSVPPFGPLLALVLICGVYGFFGHFAFDAAKELFKRSRPRE